MREGDKRWISQYEALFCVLNSIGQVVTWKLTNGLSFTVVEDILLAVQRRLEAQGKQLKEFYIDNCCAWRKKLQQVFGEELNVCLDIISCCEKGR